MRDLRGTELQVGQIVAYNWSGRIATGEIVKLAAKAGYTSKPITVKQIAPNRQDTPSKIGDSSSVLVLFEDYDGTRCAECGTTPIFVHNVGCSRENDG